MYKKTNNPGITQQLAPQMLELLETYGSTISEPIGNNKDVPKRNSNKSHRKKV